MKKRVVALVLALAMILTCINLPSVTASAYDADTYEAEDATSFGGAGFANDHGGYTGTGFMAGFSEVGRGITFENINVSETGYYMLGIRYANGGDPKTLSVYTNEDTANAQRVEFLRTWGWDYWGLGVWGYKYVNVYLQKGANSITIAYLSGDSGNINIDHIKLAKSLITVVDNTSKIVNNGFDAGNSDGWTVTDNGNRGFGVDNGDTAEGTHKFYFWTGSSPYQQRISQTVTGLENGTYVVGLFVKISINGPTPSARLELTSYDGDKETFLDFVVRPDSQNPYEWYEQEVEVKDGQLTIAVYCDSPGNVSVQLDAFKLYHIVDKNALNSAIKNASALNESDYTQDSWDNFQTALDAAIDVLNNQNATQVQTNNALIALTTAQSNLQEVVAEFTVTATAGQNGSITPAEQKVEKGNTATFSITPDEGYEIDTITVTPEKEYTLTGNTLSIADVQSDLQVNVTFKKSQVEPIGDGIILDLDFSKYTGDGTEPAPITDNTGHLTLYSNLKAETIRGKTGIRFTGSNKDTDLVHWSAATYDPFSQISQGVTINMWINIQSRTRWEHIFNFATGKNYIDDEGDTQYTGNVFIFQLTDSSDRFLRAGIMVNGNQAETYTGGKEIGKDRWTLITFTQNTATKEIVIYVNGERFHSFQSSQSLYELSNAANATEKGPKSVNYFIGGPQPHAWDSDFGVDAVMSRFTIYNRALTDEEVANLYNPNQQNADYTAVHNAIDAAEAEIERGIYTEASVAALIASINSVDWNKTVSEQKEVDAMASAILNAIEALVRKSAPDEVMQKLTYTDEDGTTLPYRLYVPDDYDSKKDYPLLLFLHGAGERGNDNKKHIEVNNGIIRRIISSDNPEYDCIIVAPQCAENSQWVDTDWSKGSYDQSKVAMSKYLKATHSLLNELQKNYSIDSRRLYITGISMGGYGTWDYITRYPDLFAAAIPICGAGDPTKAEAIKTMPIWAFHGDADGVVPVQGSRDMVEALEELDSPIRYTEYQGVGHDCWNNAYEEPELLSWLFDQVKPELVSIEVTTLPAKLVYNEGEEFDPTGMVVTAYYDDGSSKVVTDYIIDGYDSTPGVKIIIITYGDMIDMFEVEVKPAITIPGDVNGDGRVTVVDIVALRVIIMSGEEPTEEQLAVADLNNDDRLTVTDIVAIRNLIMNQE